MVPFKLTGLSTPAAQLCAMLPSETLTTGRLPLFPYELSEGTECVL